MTTPIIIIPARMDSTRLPGKPLADIHGKPMIQWVMERALAAKIAPVYIACAEEEIANAIRNAGGQAILTDPAHPSGTDRIYEALQKIDPAGKFDRIINVQGDLPMLDPDLPARALALLDTPSIDISTLAAPIRSEEERHNPNVVKAVITLNKRAIYFSRSPVPYGDGPCYHHIGLYAYTRKALETFVSLPASPLEKMEKLEQLRALENDMQIAIDLVDKVPLGVDTPEDLEFVRKHI